MYREFFSHSPLLMYPLLALALFLGVFSLIVARTLGRRADSFDDRAALPLDDERRPSEVL
ncbi:MAG: CcoQ/FixQ family Cbb3-type cytochrome c oxidase assembly chaperone [Myxococcales bacterium]|nr:CcoQ/FixQ family Cbb3-type cytochrome c oxidase assembly chaperone [Myxococcales bacterium]